MGKLRQAVLEYRENRTNKLLGLTPIWNPCVSDSESFDTETPNPELINNNTKTGCKFKIFKLAYPEHIKRTSLAVFHEPVNFIVSDQFKMSSVSVGSVFLLSRMPKSGLSEP